MTGGQIQNSMLARFYTIENEAYIVVNEIPIRNSVVCQPGPNRKLREHILKESVEWCVNFEDDLPEFNWIANMTVNVLTKNTKETIWL